MNYEPPTESRRILIFGASGSIGKALYSILSSGNEVIRSSSSDGYDIKCDFANADLSALALPKGMVIDGVVFAQGINPRKGFHDISASDFQEMINVNVVSPALACRSLAPHLADDASIVFLSSVATRKGSYDPSYAAAKSALEGLMHCLANSLPKQRVNIVSLGLVEGSTVHRGMTADFAARHSQKMRNGKLVDVNDVASLIREVLENKSLNRAIINLDCGYSN